MNDKHMPTARRIESLDMLRGISLLGIFIANMLLFHTPYLYIDPYSYFDHPTDQTTFQWIALFVQGSFYPIFAFLFGYGLNMQYEKAIQKKQPYVPFMAKRLSILLVFGVLHALFLWSGDILFTYAVLGFLLLFALRIPKRWLLGLSMVLYIIPIGFLVLITMFLNAIEGFTMQEMTDHEQIVETIRIFQTGTYGEIFATRAMDWLIYGVMNTLFVGFMILGIMMFGAAMSKLKLFERAVEFKSRLLGFGVIFTVIGLFVKAVPFIQGPNYVNIQIQTTLGGVLLAVGYTSLFLIFSTYTPFMKFLSPIAYAGRMSLTTYIMQSVIATTIFYAYGFGLYGKVSLLTGTLMAIGIYLLQVLFAQLWLSKFQQGPLEALWRKGTYGRKQ